MKAILFEDEKWKHFLPLVYTKPLGMLRVGALTMADRWQQVLDIAVGHHTRDYLRKLFGPDEDGSLFINARLVADRSWKGVIENLRDDECVFSGTTLLVARSSSGLRPEIASYSLSREIEAPFLIEELTDLFTQNGRALKIDFELLTSGKQSEALHPSVIVIGDPSQVFLAKGARVLASTLNVTDGPVYLDSDAEIMEGSHIRGAFYLGEHSQVKMGGKIYGPTSIGPHCKVGGEISNSVIQGFSNKAHDGFIGNSLIGEWCNLGADTNTSNLKNNYSNVKTFRYATETMGDTKLTFCGLTMGDHSKCGINTMFNTGTVVGVGSNIFGGSFPPKHIPSFCWGGSDGFEEYDIVKMMATASNVYARRSLILTDEHREILRQVFLLTAKHRLGTTQSQE